MIAGLHRRNTLTDLHHHARAFVAEHAGKQSFRIITAQGECIRVADPGVADLHKHLALARRRDVDLDDFQRFAGSKGNGSTGFHAELLGLSDTGTNKRECLGRQSCTVSRSHGHGVPSDCWTV